MAGKLCYAACFWLTLDLLGRYLIILKIYIMGNPGKSNDTKTSASMVMAKTGSAISKEKHDCDRAADDGATENCKPMEMWFWQKDSFVKETMYVNPQDDQTYPRLIIPLEMFEAVNVAYSQAALLLEEKSQLLRDTQERLSRCRVGYYKELEHLREMLELARHQLKRPTTDQTQRKEEIAKILDETEVYYFDVLTSFDPDMLSITRDVFKRNHKSLMLANHDLNQRLSLYETPDDPEVTDKMVNLLLNKGEKPSRIARRLSTIVAAHADPEGEADFKRECWEQLGIPEELRNSVLDLVRGGESAADLKEKNASLARNLQNSIEKIHIMEGEHLAAMDILKMQVEALTSKTEEMELENETMVVQMRQQQKQQEEQEMQVQEQLQARIKEYESQQITTSTEEAAKIHQEIAQRDEKIGDLEAEVAALKAQEAAMTEEIQKEKNAAIATVKEEHEENEGSAAVRKMQAELDDLRAQMKTKESDAAEACRKLTAQLEEQKVSSQEAIAQAKIEAAKAAVAAATAKAAKEAAEATATAAENEAKKAATKKTATMSTSSLASANLAAQADVLVAEFPDISQDWLRALVKKAGRLERELEQKSQELADALKQIAESNEASQKLTGDIAKMTRSGTACLDVTTTYHPTEMGEDMPPASRLTAVLEPERREGNTVKAAEEATEATKGVEGEAGDVRKEPRAEPEAGDPVPSTAEEPASLKTAGVGVADTVNNAQATGKDVVGARRKAQNGENVTVATDLAKQAADHVAQSAEIAGKKKAQSHVAQQWSGLLAKNQMAQMREMKQALEARMQEVEKAHQEVVAKQERFFDEQLVDASKNESHVFCLWVLRRFGAIRAGFRAMDTTNSGDLSFHKLEKALHPQNSDFIPFFASRLMTQLDSDGDGSISLEEVIRTREEWALEENQRDYVSMPEFMMERARALEAEEKMTEKIRQLEQDLVATTNQKDGLGDQNGVKEKDKVKEPEANILNMGKHKQEMRRLTRKLDIVSSDLDKAKLEHDEMAAKATTALWRLETNRATIERLQRMHERKCAELEKMHGKLDKQRRLCSTANAFSTLVGGPERRLGTVGAMSGSEASLTREDVESNLRQAAKAVEDKVSQVALMDDERRGRAKKQPSSARDKNASDRHHSAEGDDRGCSRGDHKRPSSAKEKATFDRFLGDAIDDPYSRLSQSHFSNSRRRVSISPRGVHSEERQQVYQDVVRRPYLGVRSFDPRTDADVVFAEVSALEGNTMELSPRPKRRLKSASEPQSARAAGDDGLRDMDPSEVPYRVRIEAAFSKTKRWQLLYADFLHRMRRLHGESKFLSRTSADPIKAQVSPSPRRAQQEDTPHGAWSYDFRNVKNAHALGCVRRERSADWSPMSARDLTGIHEKWPQRNRLLRQRSHGYDKKQRRVVLRLPIPVPVKCPSRAQSARSAMSAPGDFHLSSLERVCRFHHARSPGRASYRVFSLSQSPRMRSCYSGPSPQRQARGQSNHRSRSATRLSSGTPSPAASPSRHRSPNRTGPSPTSPVEQNKRMFSLGKMQPLIAGLPEAPSTGTPLAITAKLDEGQIRKKGKKKKLPDREVTSFEEWPMHLTDVVGSQSEKQVVKGKLLKGPYLPKSKPPTSSAPKFDPPLHSQKKTKGGSNRVFVRRKAPTLLEQPVRFGFSPFPNHPLRTVDRRQLKPLSPRIRSTDACTLTLIDDNTTLAVQRPNAKIGAMPLSPTKGLRTHTASFRKTDDQSAHRPAGHGSLPAFKTVNQWLQQHEFGAHESHLF